MELLIEAVRARPVLWDCSLEVYRDNILKNTAWEKVASLVNEEKTIVKDKWKKLRDCHRQALQRRKTTTGQAATKNKKWKHEDQMQFLLKTMAHGPSDSNVPPPVDDTQVANEEEEEDSEDVTELQLEGNDESATTNDIPAGTPSQKRQRSPKGADKIISFMREKHEHKMRMNKPRELDDIDLFFASAAQSVRRLPRRLQNKVKINLLNSIAAAEEEHEWHTANTPNLQVNLHSGNSSRSSASIPSPSGSSTEIQQYDQPSQNDSESILMPVNPLSTYLNMY